VREYIAAMSAEPFSVRMAVRIYELDPQRHVAAAVYLQYADHSRFACMQAAGVSVDALLADGIGPVNLETIIRYHSELRMGDDVDVSCAWIWGKGKTYRVEHELRRPDEDVAAEVHHASGLLNLETRRLIENPAAELLCRASRPRLLGLA
jgi:acyl-CoA thioester hydrolase